MNDASKVSFAVQERSGFSLVEVMIAMAVFSVAALGLSKTVMLTRKMSEFSIYQTTAHGVAFGYAEQMMAMSLEEILISREDTSIALAMSAISPSSQSLSQEIDDFLYVDAWESKDIVIDIRDEEESERSITMPMRFRVEANYLNSGSDPRDAVEVTLSYSYQSPVRASDEWIDDSLRFVKSSVPIY